MYKTIKTMTDEELIESYHENVLRTLGSVAELMYERGYDIADILEQERLEKETNEYVDKLERELCKRGIDAWEGYDGSRP